MEVDREPLHEPMLDKAVRPDRVLVDEWLGAEAASRWHRLVAFIAESYPGVFPQHDWVFGGKKHGWALRFKRSSSFCTLVPEWGRALVVIVFGAKDRAKVEANLSDLGDVVRQAYLAAPTYADGRWMPVALESDDTVEDVIRLLMLKRRPRPSAGVES